MVQVSYRNSNAKVLKNEWVQVNTPPPCAQAGVKKKTYVLRSEKRERRIVLNQIKSIKLLRFLFGRSDSPISKVTENDFVTNDEA